MTFITFRMQIKNKLACTPHERVLPSINIRHFSHFAMLQQKSNEKSIARYSTREVPISLLEIDDLENRVCCVNRKLTIAGFSHMNEVFSSFYVIPLQRIKNNSDGTACSFKNK